MTDDEFEQYLSNALAELEEKQKTIEEEYGVGHHDRYVIEYEKGLLIFFEKEKPVVEAKILPVATHVREKESMRWFWADERLPEEIRNESSLLKGLGRLTGFDMFENRMVECDDQMVWEICALGCKFLNKLGAYRVPQANLDGYVLFSEFKKYC